MDSALHPKISLTNVVINFSELNHDLINKEGLEGLIKLEQDRFGASLFEGQNFKRIVLPQSKKQVVITPDRKVIVEDVSGDTPDKSKLIKLYLENTLTAISGAALKPLSYGFNYSIVVSDVNAPPRNPEIESKFSGYKILATGNRIIYTDDKKRLDLRFEPNLGNRNQYIFNLNCHYELTGELLPENAEFNRQYIDNWNHFLQTVGKILPRNG